MKYTLRSLCDQPSFLRDLQWELTWEGVHGTSSELLPYLIAGLPPRDLARKLIDLFFEHVNVQFPLLHRPTFERQWTEGCHYRDIWFSCLCFSVFAVASRWSEDPRVLVGSPSEDAWRQAGRKYFEAAICTFHFLVHIHDSASR